MEKRQYQEPSLTVYQMKICLLTASENLGIDDTHIVSDDNAVFSRGGDEDWDEE